MRRSDISIVLVAAFVFADATIVTLALPNLLVDLHTTVYGVAAVLGVYTATLGAAALVLTRVDYVRPWWAIAALCVFSLASVACALADGLALLVVARSEERRVGMVCWV